MSFERRKVQGTVRRHPDSTRARRSRQIDPKPEHDGIAGTDRAALTPAAALALQRLAGNGTVQSIVRERRDGAGQQVSNGAPLRALRPRRAPADVVRRLLVEDLTTGKLDAAIAGEMHGEIPTKQERGAWRRHKIAVHYEADTIPLATPHPELGGAVTPDHTLARVLFAWTTFYEAVEKYLDPSQASELAKVIEREAPGLGYVLSVLVDEMNLVEGLRGQGAVTGLIEDLTGILGGAAEGAKLAEFQRVAAAKKMRANVPVVNELMQAVHRKSPAVSEVPFSKDEFRMARSRQMLRVLDVASSGLRNTIYKVGNDHVKDMRREGMKPKGKVGVFDTTQYKAELAAVTKPRAAPSPKAKAKTPPARGAAPPASGASTSSSTSRTPRQPTSSASSSSRAKTRQPTSSASSSSRAKTRQPASSASSSSRAKTRQPTSSASSSSRAKTRQPASSSSSTSRTPRERSPDQRTLDRVQALLDANRAKCGDAQGFQDIEAALRNGARRPPAAVVAEIRAIIVARNRRWAITKLIVRSAETQRLYDQIEAVVG